MPDRYFVFKSCSSLGKVLKIEKKIGASDAFEEKNFKYENLNQMDCLWVLSFGKRQLFLDTIEILWILEKKTKVLNSTQSLMFVNNKYSLSHFSDMFLSPETYASCRFDLLWSIYEKNKERIWVLKPPAESLGRDVFLLKPGDTNVKALMQLMTGGKSDRYCLLQEYIPHIEQGEKRVLVANGKVICYYIRKQGADSVDHRTNLHQGAIAQTCDLSISERELCEKIGNELKSLGAYFIGIDLVYPYVVEINVISPGGLSTVCDLTGNDFSEEVIKCIFETDFSKEK